MCPNKLVAELEFWTFFPLKSLFILHFCTFTTYLIEVVTMCNFLLFLFFACMYAQLPSHVGLFANPWTVALQAPLSMGFSRQEYWNGLPFPSPGDFPDPQIELVSPESHALTDVSFTTEPLFHWMQTSWQQRLLDYIMFSVLHSQCRA